MQVEIGDGDVVVDAGLLGQLLQLDPADVSELMRQNAITSVCERGLDADAGQYRLSFFYGSRRARLRVDASGKVLQRSTTNIARKPANR